MLDFLRDSDRNRLHRFRLLCRGRLAFLDGIVLPGREADAHHDHH